MTTDGPALQRNPKPNTAMNIQVSRYTPDHVAVSFAAEGQAEIYQAAALLKALLAHGAEVIQWSNESGSGFTVRVRNAPTPPHANNL
jgi:hypothetical protein